MSDIRKYEPFYGKVRDEKLQKVEEAYEKFKETKTFEFPTWLYGEPIGKLFKVEVEDCPNFGDTAYVEMDSARTAFISVDMQIDFCGKNGYVDVMGYDLNNTAAALEPIHNALEAIRGTDIKVIHTREGHEPDLSDAPFNKVLRSKIIGDGVGIGDIPKDGLGRLLVRGEPKDRMFPKEKSVKETLRGDRESEESMQPDPERGLPPAYGEEPLEGQPARHAPKQEEPQLNPDLAKTERDRRSAPNSTQGPRTRAISSRADRPSVREKLESYKADIARARVERAKELAGRAVSKGIDAAVNVVKTASEPGRDR